MKGSKKNLRSLGGVGYYFGNKEKTMFDWILDRINERTSWDGIMILVISLMILLVSPLAKLFAWAGIAWGIFTIWKLES